VSTHLSRIVEQRKLDVAQSQKLVPLALLRQLAESSPRPLYPLLPALLKPAPGRIHLIAEVKKASPSKGIICADFDPLALALGYYKAGASALSVLTEPHFFLGSPAYLQDIAKKVPLPVLRKDFINHIYQIYEARIWGAGAFLLIVASCEASFLQDSIKLGLELGMTPLVEVHNAAELEIALKVQAPLIGINNRNLASFEVSLQTTFDLITQIPPSIPVVSESGIFTAHDAKTLTECGAKAILVGESLVKDPSILPQKVQELLFD